MEEELEIYLDQYMNQDVLASTSSHLFSPIVPYDSYFHISSNQETFASHLEPSKGTSTGFSSVDLSFLPDDVNQENTEQTLTEGKQVEGNHEMQGDSAGLQSLNEKNSGGIGTDNFSFSNSTLNPQSNENSTLPSSENSSSDFFPLASLTPLMPMASVSEGSGIVPQLQNVVSTVNLACKLDLKNIALRAKNVEYNPKVRIFRQYRV